MKNNTGKKRQTSIYFEKEDLNNFQNKYPNMLSTFLRNALKIGLSDYNYFVKTITYTGEKRNG